MDPVLQQVMDVIKRERREAHSMRDGTYKAGVLDGLALAVVAVSRVQTRLDRERNDFRDNADEARRRGVKVSYEPDDDDLLACRLEQLIEEGYEHDWRNAARREAAKDCPECNGEGLVELPRNDDVEDGHRCPLCRPWPQGFPGLRMFGRWLVSPYGPGECAPELQALRERGAA